MVSELDIGRCTSEEAKPRSGVDTRWCASKDVGPWKRADWGVPHWLEKGTSASEDARPRRGGGGGLWDPTSVGEGNETFFTRVWKPLPSRCWTPGGWIVRSNVGWRGERNILYKGVETSPYRHVLKILRGSPKGKPQRGQYLLAVGLG